jgi:hypothetical protein
MTYNISDQLILSILNYFILDPNNKIKTTLCAELDPYYADNEILRKIIRRLKAINFDIDEAAASWLKIQVAKSKVNLTQIKDVEHFHAVIQSIKTSYARRDLLKDLKRYGENEQISDADMENIRRKINLATKDGTGIEVYHGDNIPDPSLKRQILQPYPLKSINEKIGGMHINELIFVGGRPGMGKSSFIYNVILDAISHDTGALLFTPEITINDAILNLACLSKEIDSQKIQTDSLNDEEKAEIKNAAAVLRTKPLWVVDKAPITIGEITAMSEKLLLKNKEIKIIFIDYIQLIASTTNDIRANMINTTQNLLYLKKELNTCVMIASQLNRNADEQWEYPTMSLFKESSSIEEQGDVIMFLARPFKYDPNEYNRSSMHFHVIKNRNGISNFMLDLIYDETIRRFNDPKLGGAASSVLKTFEGNYRGETDN